MGINDSIYLTIENVQNYTNSKIAIPGAHKKLTILHLISTTCAPCLAKIPRLDGYQQQFDKEIQIILVFREDLKNINKYKQFVTELQNTKLPIITKESGLYNKFKISVFGDNVWIDDQGIIKMQNRIEDLNPTTITDFLKSKKTVKSQVYHEMDKNKSFLENLGINSNNNLISSFQMFRLDRDYIEQTRLSWEIEANKNHDSIRIYSYNTELRRLAKILFNQRLIHNSRVVFDIKNKEQLLPDFNEQNPNHFAFELIFNNGANIDPMQYLKKEIENSLSIRFTDTILDTKCYVLKRFKSVDIKTKHIIDATKITGAQSKFNNEMRSISDDLLLTLNSYRWGDIVGDLNLTGNRRNFFEYYIVDETGIDIDEKVDIQFYVTTENIELINESLNKYGLRLEKALRPLPVILIKDGV
ncbi:MAG: hypothetical protein JNM21_14840 [Taibaiella sp.]|nr:hypothetical protein [Taibaiella sp.]